MRDELERYRDELHRMRLTEEKVFLDIREEKEAS